MTVDTRVRKYKNEINAFKDICAGILFKYATDKELSSGFWMYGGDGRKDEYALKSANHEMKGIIRFDKVKIALQY